ncbi:MAG: sigma-54-dependent Fis family transcriptional regulator [Chloroflexi bacterium]|nr:sigma-54-dependent Fis family transcriptional regulator [Chloroflexota bacterium]
MTATTAVRQLWIHSFRPGQGLRPEAVAHSLTPTGFVGRALRLEDRQGPGIIIVPEISQAICEFVRTVSGNGARRVLAILEGEAPSASQGAWEVLQAGASDVLIWNELSDPGNAISARFRRWQEVDELVESPLVVKNLVGGSPAWKSVVRRVVEVARFTDSPVLLIGETGTGKELLARLIHTLDEKRNQRSLVVLDCSTIVPELSGSELFGHERGAFTGAVAARDGAFALADGGTLFLDEVGELPLGLQTQLLRALQEHTYKRVGSNSWRRTDFRLICATNRDLPMEEARGHFRRDLYYRVAAWTIRLPSLRKRAEDIIPLVRHFMRLSGMADAPPELEAAVKTYFVTRDYPGNVRDLQNLVHRIMTSYVGVGPITLGNVPPDERPEANHTAQDWFDPASEQAIRQAVALGVGLREIRRAVEAAAIRIAIEGENGNLKRAAHKLGVTDRALQKRKAGQYQREEGSATPSSNCKVEVLEACR